MSNEAFKTSFQNTYIENLPDNLESELESSTSKPIQQNTVSIPCLHPMENTKSVSAIQNLGQSQTHLKSQTHSPEEMTKRTQVHSPEEMTKRTQFHSSEEMTKRTINSAVSRVESVKEEQVFICKRYNHLDYCACSKNSCKEPGKIVEVFPHIFLGDLNCAFNPKMLMDRGIKFILDLSQEQYTRRDDLFSFLELNFASGEEDEIKRNFRLTNRLLTKTLDQNHSAMILYSKNEGMALAFALAREMSSGDVPLKLLLLHAKKKNVSIDMHHQVSKQLDMFDMARQISNKDKL